MKGTDVSIGEQKYIEEGFKELNEEKDGEIWRKGRMEDGRMEEGKDERWKDGGRWDLRKVRMEDVRMEEGKDERMKEEER